MRSPAQVQVNTVNTVGVMGKGIALEFKNKYPEMFVAYQRVCEKNLLDIGKLYLWKDSEKWILLFPTKRHWRSPSKLEYIEKGLQKFVDNYERKGIESIAFPKLGCGNGNLDWADVQPIMEKYLKPLPITVYIYIDYYDVGVPEHKDEDFPAWVHSEPRDISFHMLKEELQEAFRKNVDFSYYGEIVKNIQWEKNEIKIYNGKTIIIEEKDLCEFWDYIKNVGVVDVAKIPKMHFEYADVMMEILKKLEYLQPILIVNDGKESEDSRGYQFIAG